MIRAVAFDLNDTLYPEADFVCSGFRAASAVVEKRYGWSIAEELIARFRAGQRGDLFTPVLAQRLDAVEESFVQELVLAYRRHVPHLQPFPECRGALEQLRRRLLLAVISDGWLEVQQRKLESLAVGGYFAAVVFSDRWGREYWKPHARPYIECAKLLAVRPEEMAYVGDNPTKDFVGARRLGIATVRIRRPGGLHSLTPASGEQEADFEIDRLDALLPLLASLHDKQIAQRDSEPCREGIR